MSLTGTVVGALLVVTVLRPPPDAPGTVFGWSTTEPDGTYPGG